ncbi:MAG: hypothetical protein EP338_03830 [Bacteroidetes bacterium]|nr:MAG: hypothetical protein EP338_03830 [Bacteroidota bacterium]
MIEIVRHSGRFVLFVLAQTLIFNQLEIGYGIQFMVYPLFILLLPIELNIFVSMLIAFLLGFSVDMLSNTYGLHASSAVLVAYLKPYFFSMFEPRDSYEPEVEPNFHTMEFRWILYVHGVLLALHHLWFFTIEIFKFNEILYILQKTLISLPCSFLLCILIQLVFVKKASTR